MEGPGVMLGPFISPAQEARGLWHVERPAF